MKVQTILGPPGTGKTTTLLNIVEQELRSGVAPNRIGYVSFTRKATNEAIERACEKFDTTKGDMPYFRTLHSLCYQMLGLSREVVMQPKHYRELGKLLGIEFSEYYPVEEGLPAGSKEGDELLFIEAYSRARCLSIEQVLYETDSMLNPFEVRQFIETLKAYKRDMGLLDYTDMLENFVAEEITVPCRVVIIDEAQDLSTLQWKVARTAFRRAERVYIAGDDDQCIYQWSGADIGHFLKIKGEKSVLEQSYRLPRKIWQVADRIAHTIGARYKKVWRSRDDEGEVNYISDPDNIDLKQGTWLLLARNNFMLDELKAIAVDQGVAYSSHKGASVDPEHVGAIKAWTATDKGKPISGNAVKLVAKTAKIKRGYRKQIDALPDDRPVDPGDCRQMIDAVGPWHEALTKIPAATRAYYQTLLRSGEGIDKPPRIHISSIHGVKGGEADNVLLVPDMAWRCWRSMERSPDGEARVFYVGVTRARKALYMVNPRTKYYFRLP